VGQPDLEVARRASPATTGPAGACTRHAAPDAHGHGVRRADAGLHQAFPSRVVRLASPCKRRVERRDADSHLYAYAIDVPAGATTLTLPMNERIKIVAATVSDEATFARPAAPLYDTLQK
jgi:hypothetical protein